MLSEMMSELVTERRASLIEGLVEEQGAKVEELAFFFNMSVNGMVELLELECINIVHRMKTLTHGEKEGLAEARSGVISSLRQETWDDEALGYFFNVYDIHTLEYVSDEDASADLEDFKRYMELERSREAGDRHE